MYNKKNDILDGIIFDDDDCFHDDEKKNLQELMNKKIQNIKNLLIN